MSESPTIGYFTSIYPRASDSFIRNEVASLRRQGMEVQTIAIRRPGDEQLVTDELRSAATATHYLLDEGMLGLAFAATMQIVAHPLRFLMAARLLFKSHPAGLRQRVYQLAYLAEAACLARYAKSRGIRHVHNHIGENSATVAMIASEMSTLTYSMTIHGPGIFFHARRWALGAKIARSSFTACITHFCLSQCMIFSPPEMWHKLRVIRCGVGDSFLRAQTAPVPETPRFVCVGRLCPEKGHLLLLDAIKKIVADGGFIELHLIGDGESREAIETFVSKNGLEPNVILHGWASSEKIREELKQSRALVLPSFAEGLPVVFMEAMALERPVIATRIAGVSELVEDQVNGWLVSAADGDSLREVLEMASECTSREIQRMGEQGRAAVLLRHDSEYEAQKLGRLIRSSLLREELPTQATLNKITREQARHASCSWNDLTDASAVRLSETFPA